MTNIPCTESKVLPTLDVVWAGLNALGTVLIAADQEAQENPGVGMAFGVAWTVFSGFSAKSGYAKVDQCRAAREALGQRRNADTSIESPTVDNPDVLQPTEHRPPSVVRIR